MNKIQDADFMIQFPPALKKDKSMLALGEIIAEELHITARETRKNIIYANIEELSETWLDVLAYDLHVDWYDHDYPIEIKRAIIKDSIKIHQKLGTKYAVETALRNVYKGAGISEWFEYGGRPYYFKININIGSSGFPKGAYQDILGKVWFYKNLRSHCDGIYISLKGGDSVVRIMAGSGSGAVLKVKAKTADQIKAVETLHIITNAAAGADLKVKPQTTDNVKTKKILHISTVGVVGVVLKAKPVLPKQIQAHEAANVSAGILEANTLQIKTKLPRKLSAGVEVQSEAHQKTGNRMAVKREI